MGADEKIEYINTFIFGSLSQCVLNGLLIPLAITLFYIFIYPFLAEPVYEFSLKMQLKLNGIKQKIESNKFLTLEQSVALRNEISILRERRNEEVKEKDEEISFLKSQLDSLKSELNNSQMPQQNDPSTSELEGEIPDNVDKNEIKELSEDELVLIAISENEYKNISLITDYLNRNGIDSAKVRVKHYIDRLIDMSFIEGGSSGYSLTKYGREHIIKNNLDNKFKKEYIVPF